MTLPPMSDFVARKIEEGRAHPLGESERQEGVERVQSRLDKHHRTREAHARAFALAEKQGVEPAENIADWPGDPNPEEDDVDEFYGGLMKLEATKDSN